MTFDPTKPVQTRNGWKARVHATDPNGTGGTTIATTITDPATGVDYNHLYHSDGRYFFRGACGFDLINTPEKHVRWMNFYSDGSVSVHAAESHAYYYRRLTKRIACIRVEFEDGEGLD